MSINKQIQITVCGFVTERGVREWHIGKYEFVLWSSWCGVWRDDCSDANLHKFAKALGFPLYEWRIIIGFLEICKRKDL